MVAEHSPQGDTDVALEKGLRTPATDPATDIVVDIRGDEPVIRIEGGEPAGLLAATPFQRLTKRVIDILGSLVGLVLLSPVLIIVSAAILVTSPGPIFYISDRVGKDGKVFRFVKFRTMRTRADYEKPELIDLNEVDGPIFKIRDDPRVTPFGRVLRKYSIDEFPQLVHVLFGQMSLVGPRPPIPEEVAEYSEYHHGRLAVKPGLTCTWQVEGRSDLDFETWVKLDLEYIRTWTTMRDLELIVRTIPAVLSGRGAY
jgi:lipopolysaccharide/colanic/teichoic acid biosynthesis glycosyltransferase